MLIIGLHGPELSPDERARLMHPAVAGAILFARNIVDPDQSQALIADIRASRDTPLLVCVDQEGGPVQRFRDGYAPLPPLSAIGARHDADPDQALALAHEHGWLMASEMRAIGVDLSFAPVLDLKCGNRAIGERAFHVDPEVCAALGVAYIGGMRAAGMRATAKHFPGHGSVLEDTHHDQAIDRRPWPTIEANDLVPFAASIRAGVEAMMMAHVTYPQVDSLPAGYSEHWIRHVLRDTLGFDGIVLSDDVAMVAAEGAGSVGQRVLLHLEAGCDAVLVCRAEHVDEALAVVPWDALDVAQDRLLALVGDAGAAADRSQLHALPRYGEAVAAVTRLA
jgi:beta-N-acetylhexosaminidase